MTIQAVVDLGSSLPSAQYLTDAGRIIPLASPAWPAWLADAQHTAFRVITPHGRYTARRERRNRSGHWYWYGSRRHGGRLTKVYLGTTEDLTVDRLLEVGRKLAALQPPLPRARGRQNKP